MKTKLNWKYRKDDSPPWFFSIFIVTLMLLAITCEKKAQAQDLTQIDTIYCPYNGTIIGSIGLDAKGLGVIYISELWTNRPLALSICSGKAFWYDPNIENVKLYSIGIGSEIYRWNECHTVITLNYNQIMNYNDLSSNMQLKLDKRFHNFTFELIGYVDITKSIVFGLGYDFIDWKGRFLFGYKF